MLVVEHSSVEIRDPFFLGHAIGLIVGEGSFTGDRHAWCLAVKLHESDAEPLKKLRDIFGGQILRALRSMWVAGTVSGCCAAANSLMPCPPLSLATAHRKRDQLETWAAKYGYLSRRTRWAPQVSEVS